METKHKGNPLWAPGTSGNPSGRPKKIVSLTAELRTQLDQPCPHAPGKTWLQYLVACWLKLAAKNPHYFRELIERIEGKVTQPISGDDTKSPILIKGVIDKPI